MILLITFHSSLITHHSKGVDEIKKWVYGCFLMLYLRSFMKILQKFTNFLAVLAMFSCSLFAEEFWLVDDPWQSQPYQCCPDPCDNCSTQGIEVFGEFLYWKIVQEQMAYAAVLTGEREPFESEHSEPIINLFEKLRIKDPSFKFDSGFRIGVGYKMPCSCWNFKLAWTRLHERTNSHVNDSNHGIIPLAVPAGTIFGVIHRNHHFRFANRATSHWKFEYDAIDLTVGGNYCFSCLKMNPYVGIKAASIKQNQHLNYFGFVVEDNPVEIQNRKKNDFYGIGPSLGVDGSWEFFPHFSLNGGVSGALLYGRFRVNEHPRIAIESDFASLKVKDSRNNRIRPMVDANIGLDWDTCVCDKYQITIGAAYEVQYWWNQLQAPATPLVAFINGGSSCQGDLMMYGLTLRLAFAF